MRDYRKLRVWQEAHRLTLAVYAATKTFPKEELYGLTSQMRRAAVSIEANLAEGCGRQTDPELHRYALIAIGSANELECHLLIAHDLGMLSSREHEELTARVSDLRRMLTGLVQKLAPVAKSVQAGA